MNRYLWRALAVWCAILVMAFANGALRELLLVPAWGKTAGLVASGLLLSALIVVLAFASIRWIGTSSRAQALQVGVLWLMATLAFEFGFGAGVQHKPMHEMLDAYRLQGGNLWPLVLLACLFAPLAAYWLRGRPIEPARRS